MKALTVQQPWAWAIFNGKDVENRTAWWNHTGELAIHAGARISDRGMRMVPNILAAERDASPTLVADQVRSEGTATMGAIIGVVNVGMKVPTHHAEPGCCESWWAEQAYAEPDGRKRNSVVHYMLTDQLLLPDPVPIKGRLGLWTVPDHVVHQIKAQLL